MDDTKKRFLIKLLILGDYLYCTLDANTVYKLIEFLRGICLNSITDYEELKTTRSILSSSDKAIAYLSDCEELQSIFKMIEEVRNAEK